MLDVADSLCPADVAEYTSKLVAFRSSIPATVTSALISYQDVPDGVPAEQKNTDVSALLALPGHSALGLTLLVLELVVQ
jgi:hypothetical protein